jgi:histidinol-phosphate aminotransferase
MMPRQDFRYEQSPFKIDYSLPDLLRMNLNENLVLPKSFVSKKLRECERRLDSRLYPSELDQGEMKTLRSLVASYCGTSENMVQLGCGSDQLIDLVCTMKLRRQQDQLVTVKPTFSMYSLRAKKCDARVIEAPLDFDPEADNPFPLETEKVVRICKSENTRLLVLASPNNPTPIQYNLEQLQEILDNVPAKVSVLLDEAYVEFANYNATSLLRKYQNLILLRTFSKAFGIASHRVGFFISSNFELIGKFEEVFQYPFPLTTLGAMLAGELMKAREEVLKFAEKTKSLRKQLIESLKLVDIGRFRVIPRSDANFILVETPDAERISKRLLKDYRIAIKYLPRMIANKSFVRITVGTQAMNSRLISSLKEISLRL